MTTLKDKIRDLVVEHCAKTEIAKFSEDLVDKIMETVSDDIRNFLDKTLN